MKKTESKTAVKKRPKDSPRAKYIDKLTKQLKKWDRDIESLEEKSEKRIDKIRTNFSDKIKNLKARRDELRAKLNRLEETGEKAFQDIKKDIEKLWKDTQKGFDSAKKELKK